MLPPTDTGKRQTANRKYHRTQAKETINAKENTKQSKSGYCHLFSYFHEIEEN